MTSQPPPRFEVVARFVAALPRTSLPALGDPALHPRTARALAGEFARGWSRRHLARMAQTLDPLTEPMGKVAVIAPGNLFVAAWQAVLEPWLAGNHVRVRPSQRDGGAVGWLIGQLARHGGMALPEVVSLDRAAPHQWPQFFAAEALAVWGDDTTVAAVQALATRHGFTGQLRDHGQRQALAVVDVASLTSPQLQRVMAGLARDALHGDGRGCLSLGSVVWLGVPGADQQAVHDRFASELDRQRTRLPVARRGNTDAPFVQHLDSQKETMSILATIRADVCWTPRADGWLVSAPLAALAGAWPGLGQRGVSAAFADGDLALAAALQPLAQRTSGLAIAGSPALRTQVLAAIGSCYPCRPGALQRPPCFRSTDGWPALAAYRRPLGLGD